MCNIKYEMLFTQNATNVVIIFETSPNEKPKEKKVRDMAYYIHTVWKSGRVPRVPHLIAPMSLSTLG